MTQQRPAIGFVGLGHMGGSMAVRYLAAGYSVYGTSRSPERATELEAQGLRWRNTAREVAEASDVVASSLPDDAALEAAASGDDGILAGLAAGKAWIELSTVSPTVSRRQAERAGERGATMLDTPVSGSVPQVQAGTLTIMVGGPEEAYRRVEPVLREIGTPTYIGPNGQGLVLKLAINISLAVQMLAFGEGLLLATRSGVNRDLARQVMVNSSIGSPMLKGRAPLVFDLPDEAWFTVAFEQKDIELARDLGRSLDLPLPTAECADEILHRAGDLGYAQRDLAALVEVLDHLGAQPARTP
jgi:3-hydroxyisobutyrate dehydrogenase-like beta-hydroxyacid dehydrogenase